VLKEMRIKPSLERKKIKKEPLSKTLLLMEGTKTEPRYFDTFFRTNQTQNTNIFFFYKEKEEVGLSNPKLLLTYLLDLKAGDNISLTYYTARENLLNYFKSNIDCGLDAKIFYLRYQTSVQKKGLKLEDEVDTTILKKILEELKDLFFKGELLTNNESLFSELPEMFSSITYDSEIDKLVLIVDRDQDSFTESQYDQVLNSCKKHHFTFLVTNPCFEFFLALHLDNCQSISKEKLLENKVTSKHTYAYNMLKKLDPDYEKEKYDASKYVSKFLEAYSNSLLYETNNEKLKYQIGSSIPQWLNSLIHNN